MDYHSIFEVARQEMRLLFRNFSFIFLGLLIIVSIIAFHILCHSHWRLMETMISLPSCMPYSGAFLYNWLQAFAVIVVAGGFISRDKTCHTNDALLIRPVGNLEYVSGKCGGVIGIFFILNLVVMVITMSLNLFASDSPFSFWIYLFYLFTLTLPALIFLVCVSTALQFFSRSRLLTVFMLLLLVAADALFLTGFAHGLFDFTSTRVPNTFSTLTGHPGLGLYLLHRFIYLFLGVSLLFLSLSRFRRLPNSPVACSRFMKIGGYCLVISILCGVLYLFPFFRTDQKRLTYVETSKKYEGVSKASTCSHDITCSWKGSTFKATSDVWLKNNTSRALDTLVFYLNPGLRLEKLTVGGHPSSFERESQVILVNYLLPAGDSVRVVMDYKGKIDESIGYLDINRDRYHRQELEHVFYSYGHRYAYVEDDFLLLTPEILWYPVTCSPVNLENLHCTRRDFSAYTLNVVNLDKLTCISQGRQTRHGDTIRFQNVQPLFGIALCSGQFERDSVNTSKYTWEFYNKKGHYPLEGSLCVSSEKREKPFRSQSFYPFSKVALVESPVAFHTISRAWIGETGYVYPEIVFQQEWQGKAIDYDRLLEKRQKNEPNLELERVISSEIDSRLYRLRSLFLRQDPLVAFLYPSKEIDNKYDIRSTLTRHFLFITSDKFPGINDMIIDIKRDLNNGVYDHALKDNELDALDYLSDHSLLQAMSDPELGKKVRDIRVMKGKQLYRDLSLNVNVDEFKTFLNSFFNRYRYRQVSYDQLAKELRDSLGFDILPLTEKIYKDKQLPAFWFRDVRVEHKEFEQTTGQRMFGFKVWNRSNVDGIVSLYKDIQGHMSILKSWKIKANECRKINILIDNEIWTGPLDFCMSKNRPVYINPDRWDDPETEEMDSIIDSTCFKTPGTIIVDDEDPGFNIVEGGNASLRKRSWKERKSIKFYEEFNSEGWNSSIDIGVWVNNYGEVLKRQYFKLSGRGESKVEWATRVTKPGIYQLFVYQFSNWSRNDLAIHKYRFLHDGKEEKITIEFGKRPKQQEENGPINLSVKEIKINVSYADGNTETFSAEDVEQQWIPAGTYNLSKGDIKLILDVPGVAEGEIYFADAVKWVKVD